MAALFAVAAPSASLGLSCWVMWHLPSWSRSRRIFYQNPTERARAVVYLESGNAWIDLRTMPNRTVCCSEYLERMRLNRMCFAYSAVGTALKMSELHGNTDSSPGSHIRLRRRAGLRTIEESDKPHGTERHRHQGVAREHKPQGHRTSPSRRDELVVFTAFRLRKSSWRHTMYPRASAARGECQLRAAMFPRARCRSPDLDSIDGLSPAVSQRSQKTTSERTRARRWSTTTEINETYLRLLFARVGVPHCPECGASSRSRPPTR